jgi:mono/diheme cytochrome c family protein
MIIKKKEMNRMLSRILKGLGQLSLLSGIVFMAVSCNHNRNNPGRAYMPDMYYSIPYNPYSANPVLRDSMTNQVPPAGSIARGQVPYPYKAKSMDEQILAGIELQNPVDPSLGNIQTGQKEFEIFCMDCHGAKGDGNGYLYTSKLFPAKPTSLIGDYVQKKPDGELYHVITMGSISGLMGSYASQVRPEDRWKIILYVRELAKK